MKLARIGAPGDERPCVVDDEHAVDISDIVPDLTPATLADGALARLAATASAPRVQIGTARIGSQTQNVVVAP